MVEEKKDITSNEQTTKTSEEKSNGGKKSNKIIIVAVTLVLLVAAIGAVLFLTKDEDSAEVPGLPADVVVEENLEKGELPKEVQETAEVSNTTVGGADFSFTVNENVVFKDGKSEGELMLASSENNQSYFIATIIVQETGEVVYESGAIPAGYYIPTIKLEQDLEKGEYPCTLMVNAYDVETGALQSVIASELTITVEK